MKFRKLLSLALTGIMGVSMMAAGTATTALAASAETVAGGRMKVGGIYLLENKADGGRSLNVWCSSTYPADDLSNVCLWKTDKTDTAQQWKLIKENSYYYLQSVEKPTKCLDLFTGTGTGTNYNAQLYSKSETSRLAITAGSYSDTVKIRLSSSNYSNKYLTANQNNNGTRTGTGVNDTGNVYFYSGGLTDYSQDWRVIEIYDPDDQGGSDVDTPIGNQTLIYPVNNARINVGYKVPIYQTDPQTANLGQHYAQDIVDTNGSYLTNPNNPDVYDNVIASGEGFVYASGSDYYTGNVVCVVYPNAYIKTSASGSKHYQDVTVRYWHLYDVNPEFDDATIENPVRIHKGDVIGTMGMEGKYAKGVHLHIECDTDVTPKYTCYTPSLSGDTTVLKAGTDSTINPGWVFNVGAGQNVVINKSDINSGWVLSSDYAYIGSYQINQNA